MESQSTCSSSKVLESARSYRKIFSEKKGESESGTDNCSFKKETQNVKCECKWGDSKLRSRRKRKRFWLDSENKENEALEKVKKRRLQGLEEKVRRRKLQKKILAKKLVELEEGEILPSRSPTPENSFCSAPDTSDLEEEMNGEAKRQTVFDILNDLEEGKMSMNSQSAGVLDSLVDIEDGEILENETERPVIMADDRNCQKENPTKNLGTSQLRSMDKEQQKTENLIVRIRLGKKTERPITMANNGSFQTPKNNRISKPTPSKPTPSMEERLNSKNEIIQSGKETERSVTTSDGICFSDSGIKADKLQRTSMAATCSGSPNVPAHFSSDVMLNRKELPTSPAGTVIVVESDTDSDVVELTDLKSATSTSNVKNNEVNSSFNVLKDGATGSTSVEKPSPGPQSTLDEVAMADQVAECSAETIPARNMQSTEVNSYSRGVEDCASRSTSFEKDSFDKNKENVDSIAKSSENLQSSSHVVRPAECSVHALPIQKNSAPVEVANLPGSQDRGAVAPGASASVVPRDVRAVQNTSINQAPISPASASSQSGLLQCSRSVGRHTSVPEVQASRQPLSEEAVQLSTPSIIDFQQPQLRNVQTNGNAQATLASTNANLHLRGRTQLPCYDPLQNEMDRLQKHYEQDLKMHETMMLNMKLKRDEAIEEIMKKYEMLFQDADAAMKHKRMDYEAKFLQVYLHKCLANTWILNEKAHREASTPDTRQAAFDVSNVVQNPTLQMSSVRLDQHRPVTAQFRPVMINQQSLALARPFSGHMDCSMGLPQNGYQFRVTAPHLHASWPQTMHFPVINGAEFIQQMQMSSNNH